VKTRKRLALATVLALVLCGLVVGCGGGSSSTTASEPTESTQPESTETEPGGTASAANLEGQSLVFVNYGGDAATAAKAAWVDPFEKETGVKMAMDAPTDPAKIKAMVDAGQTSWDVVDIDPATAASNCGTLFEKRSPEVDISQVDPKYITNECGVPIIVQSVALVYNKEMFGDNPPTKITDFLDTSKFPGKRVMFNYPVATLEPLLLSTGVEPEELFPLDYERAAKALEGLGSNTVLLSDLAQETSTLESGEFSMCLCLTARAAVAAENGAEVGIVWQHEYEIWDEMVAVKGSQHPEAQQAFLNFIAQPEQQAAFTEHLPYTPTTPSAKPKLSPAFEEFVSSGHEAEIETPGVYDAKWWAKNTEAALEAWTEMTAE
jgi:putative spermidine/putrescine transport system substrate-binding protein